MPRVRQQPLGFLANRKIALATQGFDELAVDDLELATRQLDRVLSLQAAGNLADGLAAHTEHVGNRFVRRIEATRTGAIQTQQQPSAKLLFRRMAAIAYRQLRDLDQMHLCVAQQQLLDDELAFQQHLAASPGGQALWPTSPSLPMAAISVEVPSSVVADSETTASVGKYTWRMQSPG